MKPLDDDLLKILVCPVDRGELWYLEKADILYNPRLKLKYEIQDGIPVMLSEESKTADDEEHARLLEEAKASGIDTEIKTQE